MSASIFTEERAQVIIAEFWPEYVENNKPVLEHLQVNNCKDMALKAQRIKDRTALISKCNSHRASLLQVMVMGSFFRSKFGLTISTNAMDPANTQAFAGLRSLLRSMLDLLKLLNYIETEGEFANLIGIVKVRFNENSTFDHFTAEFADAVLYQLWIEDATMKLAPKAVQFTSQLDCVIRDFVYNMKREEITPGWSRLYQNVLDAASKATIGSVRIFPSGGGFVPYSDEKDNDQKEEPSHAVMPFQQPHLYTLETDFVSGVEVLDRYLPIATNLREVTLTGKQFLETKHFDLMTIMSSVHIHTQTLDETLMVMKRMPDMRSQYLCLDLSRVDLSQAQRGKVYAQARVTLYDQLKHHRFITQWDLFEPAAYAASETQPTVEDVDKSSVVNWRRYNVERYVVVLLAALRANIRHPLRDALPLLLRDAVMKRMLSATKGDREKNQKWAIISPYWEDRFMPGTGIDFSSISHPLDRIVNTKMAKRVGAYLPPLGSAVPMQD